MTKYPSAKYHEVLKRGQNGLDILLGKKEDITFPNFKFALREDLKDHPEFLPTRSHSNDTCWDVRVAEPEGIWLRPFEFKTIRLGFRMFAPPGWWLELRPRSSTFAKKHIHCLYGVIDEGFQNELLLAVELSGTEFSNQPPGEGWEDLKLEFGEKIGQVRPVRREEMLVSQVSNEEFEQLCKERAGTRKEGGFGSTG